MIFIFPSHFLHFSSLVFVFLQQGGMILGACRPFPIAILQTRKRLAVCVALKFGQFYFVIRQKCITFAQNEKAGKQHSEDSASVACADIDPSMVSGTAWNITISLQGSNDRAI